MTKSFFEELSERTDDFRLKVFPMERLSRKKVQYENWIYDAVKYKNEAIKKWNNEYFAMPKIKGEE